MSLTMRNYMWVRDAAFSVGEVKTGMAANCFSVGEVQEKLGFSANTVKKYLKMMEEDGVVRNVVLAKSVTIYKFNKSYLQGITGDRLSNGKKF